MAIILGATGITFSDGTVQTGVDRIVNVTISENNSRNSLSIANQVLWSHTFNRVLTNSDIRVTAHMPGTGPYCYPFYGNYCELVNPSGTTYRSYTGANYIHSNPGYEVNFYVDYMWRAAELSSTSGSWTIRYGWETSGGGGGCRIFNVWNYNISDDSRAYQQGSTSVVKEYK
jgi:hypothetical protein